MKIKMFFVVSFSFGPGCVMFGLFWGIVVFLRTKLLEIYVSSVRFPPNYNELEAKKPNLLKNQLNSRLCQQEISFYNVNWPEITDEGDKLICFVRKNVT